ncbi:MAG TPA: hypothetical protein VLY23_17260 [Candidatus Acidoferrum sp.]|nr:hypothetical protein [Candidatus Acidoferrum sp.]
MDTRRALLQFGSLLPVLLAALMLLHHGDGLSARLQAWPVYSGVILTAFLCVSIGLARD